MPAITDWLMLGITTVYVFATIWICRANIEAAKASREQLEEMKRQYAEENRPIIEMEFCYEHRAWYILRFVNHGKATAQNVRIDLTQEFIDSLPEESFQTMLTQTKGKECIIGVNQHYDLYIASNRLRSNPNMEPVRGMISYKSRGIEYKEEIFLDLTQYMTFFSSTTDEDKMLEAVRAIEKDIKALKEVLKAKRDRNED